MKSLLYGLLLAVGTLSLGFQVNAQTTITSITVPDAVSASLVEKVTKSAPIIMSIIDRDGGFGSATYYSYIKTLGIFAQQFAEDADMKREWIANTLITYAQAYYDVKGIEVSVVEIPTTNPRVSVPPTVEVPEQPVQTYDSLQEELDNMVALWQSQKTINYTMVQQLGCYCTPEFTRPIRFEVKNGKVSQITAQYNDEQRGLVPTVGGPNLYTIPGFFALIQSAIDDGAARIDVEYDELAGYPRNITIDFDEMIADEEQYYTVNVLQ